MNTSSTNTTNLDADVNADAGANLINLQQNFNSIFEQQKNNLIHLFHAYKGTIVLIALHMTLQIWQFNQQSIQQSIQKASQTIIEHPSVLSFKIFGLILAFLPLFLITFYLTQFFKKNINEQLFKINKLLQISLIILHFYLFWVIVSIEDLGRTFFNYLQTSSPNPQSLNILQVLCHSTLLMLCMAFIYLYILHLLYLAPFKKNQKILKKTDTKHSHTR